MQFMQKLHISPHVLEAETECQVQHGPRSRDAKASSVGAQAQQHKPSLYGATQSIYHFEDNMIRHDKTVGFAEICKREMNDIKETPSTIYKP